MSANATFVLHDVSLITELCGANDTNVRYIEELLGSTIYVRGNVLHLDSTKPSVHGVFVRLCEGLVANITRGRTIHRDLIRNLFEEMQDSNGTDDADSQLSTSIYIPVIDTTIYPKTAVQKNFIASMQSSQLCIACGPAGTGKTYLSVSQAVAYLLKKRVRRLVMTRPVVEAGESLGFLPGDFSQKIAPYLYPLFDVLSSLLPPDILERLEKQRMIEVAPLAYMRGRNLDNSFIILDEAQNVSREQMKMFLTRIGINSVAVIVGDPSQCDVPAERSALKPIMELLAPVQGVTGVQFTYADVVRSDFVKRIVQLYDEKTS